jgi:DNA-binding SARP family transcriptional activator
MDQLRLLTFGGLALLVGDVTLTGPATRRHRLALLALLAVARERGLNRDKIQAYLWPESAVERARHGLNQLVYFQRRHLDGDGLFLGRKTLRLNRDLISCDVWEFEDALEARSFETAVGLHVSPFLDGFFLKGAPEFERWATAQRKKRAAQCAVALGELAARAASKGDERQAVEWWRRAADLNPFDTDTVLRLVNAWVAAGDRASAMRCAQQHEAALRAELDLPPDPRVTRLMKELRTAAPA